MARRTIFNNDKGIVLFMVLSVILIVVAMANIILMMITSQSRLTHHQVSRIQAYYAAQAGMNYAIEMLRTNASGWAPPGSGNITKTICPQSTGCNVTNSGLPYNVTITIYPYNNTLPGVAPIEAAVNYTQPQ